MPTPLPKQTVDYAAARVHMIDSQIRPNKVRDERVLGALGRLPRELFVPPDLAALAYIDEDVPIAPGRYLLEPMILARMLEEASIGPDDRVLDVAPATGYSIAALASLAKNVVAIESDAGLQRRARENLTVLGIKNVDIQQGPLAQGWKAGAPYDVIFVNGGAEIVPSTLLEQLDEGGCLIVTVRAYGPAQAAHIGEMRLYERVRGSISFRPLFDANVRLLPEFAAPRKFTF